MALYRVSYLYLLPLRKENLSILIMVSKVTKLLSEKKQYRLLIREQDPRLSAPQTFVYRRFAVSPQIRKYSAEPSPQADGSTVRTSLITVASAADGDDDGSIRRQRPASAGSDE